MAGVRNYCGKQCQCNTLFSPKCHNIMFSLCLVFSKGMHEKSLNCWHKKAFKSVQNFRHPWHSAVIQPLVSGLMESLAAERNRWSANDWLLGNLHFNDPNILFLDVFVFIIISIYEYFIIFYWRNRSTSADLADALNRGQVEYLFPRATFENAWRDKNKTTDP